MQHPIAVIFHRFGPYHCARLRALSAQTPTVSIEVVRKDATYVWDVVDDPAGLQRVTLFPELTGREPRIRELKQRLYDCLDAQQPSAVAIPGWQAPYALLALGWCIKTSTPAVLMSESTAGDKQRTFLGEAIKRRLFRLYQAALVGGQPHMEYLHRLGFPKRPVATGYDVVDNEHFSRVPEGTESEAASAFLVSCRFVPVKNLKRLLIAYAAYRRQAGTTAWRLLIAGDGPEKNEITAAIEALDLAHSVSLAGFVQYRDLPALYARAGALILPSVSEPWGLVVNEAMAAGLPVLVSNRCGCAPDLVEENRNGFTFDPYDSDELARLMLRVSSIPVEARIEMGIASRRTIARWTPETFATNLVEAVEFAAATGAPRASISDKALLWALIRRHGVQA